MKSDLSNARRFELIAGNLALDFCNTVGGKRGVVEREYLGSFLELATWGHQAGVMDAAHAAQALELAAEHPRQATGVLDRARSLREALFRIFKASLEGNTPANTDLAILNGEMACSLCRLELASVKQAETLVWRWNNEAGALDHTLGPVAHAAANLLTDPHQLARLRMCRGDTCGWLFLDASKNHSRCWCDMRDCGNRAKVRRHRAKLNAPPGAR